MNLSDSIKAARDDLVKELFPTTNGMTPQELVIISKNLEKHMTKLADTMKGLVVEEKKEKLSYERPWIRDRDWNAARTAQLEAIDNFIDHA